MLTRIGAGVLAAALLVAGVVPAAAGETKTEPNAVTEAPSRGGSRRAAIVSVIEGELGLTRLEIAAALARGRTLADLAEEGGSSGEALASALLSKVTDLVDEAAAQGRVDPERAAELVAKAEERIRGLVFEPHTRFARDTIRRTARRHAVGIVADLLDMSSEELRAELQTGRTVADVAAERGVGLEAVVDAVMAPLEERAAAAVAEGRVDADKVSERLDRVRQRLLERLSTPIGQRATDG